MSTRISAIASILVLCSSVGAIAGDWPQWRGPERGAHAPEFVAPDTWPDQLTRVWSVEGGAGLSSPVVVGGRAYLLTREGDDEVVTCYDTANGEPLWRRTYPSRFFANGGATSPRFYPTSQGRGPFATPAVFGKRVYALGVDRVLSSFSTRNGKLKWRNAYLPTELPAELAYVCTPCGCEHDGQKFDAPGDCPSCGMRLNREGLETTARRGGGNYYGAAASPLIVGDLGIVHVGNLTDGVLIAFDRKTGNERWRHEGSTIAYASPVVASIHGEQQVITLSRTAVAGVDLATGTERWKHVLDNNAHVSTPIVLDDLIVAASYRGATFALEVQRTGDAWSVKQAWENPELTQWMTSAVLDGERIHGFFFSKKGQFATLDARTGKALWTGEGRQGESASVVMAGDDLVGLKNDGTMVVLEPRDGGFGVAREYDVADSPTWTYPALFDDKILIKDENRLTLWRVGSP